MSTSNTSASPFSEPKSQSWPHHWDPQRTPSSPEQALRWIREAQRRRPIMIRALRVTLDEKGPRSAKRLQRRFLRSASSRIAALAAAYWRCGRPLDGSNLEWPVRLFEELGAVDAWDMGPARAVSFPIEKLSGERRVHKTGRLQYAIGRLQKDAAVALTVLVD